MPVKMSRDWRLKRRTIRHPSFDEDEGIVIRTYYGDHDRQRVLSASTEYRRDGDEEMVIVATLDKLHATKREIAVVSWTLKDEDGFALPFTREVLMQLPAEIASWLDSEINKDWDNLGELPASAEEAEAERHREKEDRATFQRRPLRAADGAAADVGPDDAAGAGDRPARRGGPA